MIDQTIAVNQIPVTRIASRKDERTKGSGRDDIHYHRTKTKKGSNTLKSTATKTGFKTGAGVVERSTLRAVAAMTPDLFLSCAKTDYRVSQSIERQ
ncbi:MAG: hypothetical protein FJ267_11400 [Planctomycetes bacterium]|nr:hypothetical protein [Planctomycetota bacterium]